VSVNEQERPALPRPRPSTAPTDELDAASPHIRHLTCLPTEQLAVFPFLPVSFRALVVYLLFISHRKIISKHLLAIGTCAVAPLAVTPPPRFPPCVPSSFASRPRVYSPCPTDSYTLRPLKLFCNAGICKTMRMIEVSPGVSYFPAAQSLGLGQ
jgi:hypothetical protein